MLLASMPRTPPAKPARHARKARAHGGARALGLADLPDELVVRIGAHLESARDLAAANATARLFRGAPGASSSPLEDALRARARRRGHAGTLPAELPPCARSWTHELLARERVLELAAAHSAVAACSGADDRARDMSAFVDAEGGLHTCGEEEDGVEVLSDDDDPDADGYQAPAALGHHGGARPGGGRGGGRAPVLVPTRVPSLCGVRVRAVAAGYDHLLALSDAGGVYACGGNDAGQLGLGDEAPALAFRLVAALAAQPVVCVCAGRRYSLALGAAGDAYSWGANRGGQLGHGDTRKRRWPQRIPGLGAVRVGGLSAGPAHALALSTAGALYSFGCGHNGRLGHGDEAHQYAPRRVEALAGVRAVHASAGEDHSLVVDAAGAVYSFGHGRRGRLGHGDEASQLLPKRVAALAGARALRACAGDSASAVVCADGSVRTFGRGRCGLLGLGQPATALLPTPVAALAAARVVGCCLAVTHALYVAADGGVYSCGVQAAALGHGASLGAHRGVGMADVATPTRVEHVPRLRHLPPHVPLADAGDNDAPPPPARHGAAADADAAEAAAEAAAARALSRARRVCG